MYRISCKHYSSLWRTIFELLEWCCYASAGNKIQQGEQEWHEDSLWVPASLLGKSSHGQWAWRFDRRFEGKLHRTWSRRRSNQKSFGFANWKKYSCIGPSVYSNCSSSQERQACNWKVDQSFVYMLPTSKLHLNCFGLSICIFWCLLLYNQSKPRGMYWLLWHEIRELHKDIDLHVWFLSILACAYRNLYHMTLPHNAFFHAIVSSSFLAYLVRLYTFWCSSGGFCSFHIVLESMIHWEPQSAMQYSFVWYVDFHIKCFADC